MGVNNKERRRAKLAKRRKEQQRRTVVGGGGADGPFTSGFARDFRGWGRPRPAEPEDVDYLIDTAAHFDCGGGEIPEEMIELLASGLSGRTSPDLVARRLVVKMAIA